MLVAADRGLTHPVRGLFSPDHRAVIPE